MSAPSLADAPVFVPLGPVHPHLVFEVLAYAVGFAVYRALRRRSDDFLPDATRWTVLVAAILGAAVGSKALALLVEPATIGDAFESPVAFFASGKTIVGGLLGGWLAVELTKKVSGVRERTGDLFALPLCVGMAIGRVGCFLTGLPDRTYGTPTEGPFGVDFGDGIARHPTQLYELAFLLALGAYLFLRGRTAHRRGALFREFLGAYLAFRLAVDALKPAPTFAGLDALQWASAAGLALLLYPRRS